MAFEVGLFPESSERLLNAELVESYRIGGFHPVDIGDTFAGDRYRIVRKLGHGSESTVWLARDISGRRYVAIKIIRSDVPKPSKELEIHRSIGDNKATNIVTLLDSFEHTGPNGVHDCLVFEPMGPNVVACFQGSIPYWDGRSIAKQLLTALQCLHDLRIVHADTNPGNLLLSLTHTIEDLSGGGNSVSLRVDKRNPHLPKRVYEDRPLWEYLDLKKPATLKLADLGAAFSFSDSPERPLVPVALRAPEVVLQLSSFDNAIDIWSFGCYLFEIFTGESLFCPSTFVFGPIHADISHAMNDDHLLQMIDALGQLPPAMFEKWPRRMRYFDANLKLVRTDVGEMEISPYPICVGKTLEQRFRDNMPREMTAEEGDALLRVLRSALKYDPALRPSATELLRLEWFHWM